MSEGGKQTNNMTDMQTDKKINENTDRNID